jgi:hypothetical protein
MLTVMSDRGASGCQHHPAAMHAMSRGMLASRVACIALHARLHFSRKRAIIAFDDHRDWGARLRAAMLDADSKIRRA